MTQPTKIKVDNPKVNCEVVVDKKNFQWENRYYDKETDWVYVIHRNVLWPQRQSGQYYRFRIIERLDDVAQRVFDTFMDYQHWNKGKDNEQV